MQQQLDRGVREVQPRTDRRVVDHRLRLAHADDSYTPNRMGRMAKGTSDKQMRKGFAGLADELKAESKRVTKK